MNYKDQTWLIVDNSGLSTELAIRLAREVGTILYFTEWKQGGFASSNEQQMGTGLPGVTRIQNLNAYVDAAVRAAIKGEKQPISLWIFTWCYDADLQVLLRNLGCNVFGSGKGEQLELDRIGLKKILAKEGLPVGKHKILTGFDELIKYAQTPGLPVQYVKIPGRYRANSETFRMENYQDRKDYIEVLKPDFGAYEKKVPVISEDEIPDCVEVGIDMQICGDKFPEIVSIGCEEKDVGYCMIMKPYKDLPKEITIVTDKLKPLFKYFNYAGDFSDEIRIGKDEVPYLMDCTCRSPNPASFSRYFEATNLAEVFYETAKGNPVSYKKPHKFYLEILIKSDWAKEHWQMVDVDPAFRDNYFFERLAIVDRKMYVIPHQIKLNDVGSMVVGGNTLDECYDKAEEVKKALKGSDLDVLMGCIESFKKTIEKMDKLGLNFFD